MLVFGMLQTLIGVDARTDHPVHDQSHHAPIAQAESFVWWRQCVRPVPGVLSHCYLQLEAEIRIIIHLWGGFLRRWDRVSRARTRLKPAASSLRKCGRTLCGLAPSPQGNSFVVPVAMRRAQGNTFAGPMPNILDDFGGWDEVGL